MGEPALSAEWVALTLTKDDLVSNNLHISYDLIAAGQNYAAVIERVKQLGNWAKINQSFWYVNSTFTSTQARDHIKPVLDSNDKLYVVDSTNNEAAWLGLPTDVVSFVVDKWPK